MILLQKISIKLTQNPIKQNDKKLLRISSDNFSKITKNPGKFINESLIQWSESITIPSTNRKSFDFQIVNQHQFGYNPEELSNLFHGKMIVNDKYLDGSWQILNTNNEMVGYLSAKMKIVSKTKTSMLKLESAHEVKSSAIAVSSQIPLISIIPSNDSALKVVAIVAHVKSIKAKAAFAIIKSKNSSVKTQLIKSHAGELVFIDQYNLPHNKDETQFEITIFQEGQRLIGKGKIHVQNGNICKNAQILDEQGKQIGDIFVQGSTHRKFNKQKIQSKVRYGKESIVFKNASHISSTQFSRSKKHSPSASSKKISILNSNNDIKIPQESRFVDFNDKQSHIVSYLQNRTFQFRERRTHKFYKGASIGKGEKYDFASLTRKNPGVGEYKLPSIWDKY